MRGVDFKRKRLGTFASFFLGLRGINVPVLYMIKLDFIADVVFVGQFVDMAGRLCIRHHKASLRKSIGSPDVSESAASAVSDPQAGILAVPALAQIGIGGVVVVVGVGAATVAAEETHIINKRVLPGFPKDCDGARI